jgi:hypothetical protein
MKSTINDTLYICPQQEKASRITVHDHRTKIARRCNREIAEKTIFYKKSFLPARMAAVSVGIHREEEVYYEPDRQNKKMDPSGACACHSPAAYATGTVVALAH